MEKRGLAEAAGGKDQAAVKFSGIVFDTVSFSTRNSVFYECI